MTGATQRLLDPAGTERHLLDVAVRAAHLAGAELLRPTRAVTLLGHKSTETDPVTDADLASEAVIATLLAEERPDDGILGEEGSRRESKSGLRWNIDPLDGTVNLRYGLPHFAVSIACERWTQVSDEPGSWRPLVAVVHDPTSAETFSAIRGRGARLNGEPIAVNDPVGLPTALIATGFAYGSRSRARQAEVFGPLVARARDVRSLGSAALALCWVASGRCDGYYEDELAPWDVAAGELIAQEAGAVVSPLGSGVLAAGAALYPALANLVAPPPR